MAIGVALPFLHAESVAGGVQRMAAIGKRKCKGPQVEEMAAKSV